jgi:hypothetical protein
MSPKRMLVVSRGSLQIANEAATPSLQKECGTASHRSKEHIAAAATKVPEVMTRRWMHNEMLRCHYHRHIAAGSQDRPDLLPATP